ncbi:hypothetical protein SETIT_1G075200v2 [Setaria italica]|uniref:Uncharacterized protein n=1 Tax=Setaria italica TaxID=4555 RepID=A0A368PJW3_SETIT|nr:hypothetical protein SETIT_1G075200v2 [Setaria italica]
MRHICLVERKKQPRRPSSHSCVVSTKPTILSKEYRALATQSSIRLFLEGTLSREWVHNNSNLNFLPRLKFGLFFSHSS